MFKLLVDTREKKGIPELIQEKFGDNDILKELQICSLNSGDYQILCDNKIIAIIERKTLNDLSASMGDDRRNNINNLLLERKLYNCDLYYLIEGPAFPSLNKKFSRKPYKYLESYILKLQVKYKISIIKSKNPEYTANYIIKLFNKYHDVYIENIQLNEQLAYFDKNNNNSITSSISPAALNNSNNSITSSISPAIPNNSNNSITSSISPAVPNNLDNSITSSISPAVPNNLDNSITSFISPAALNNSNNSITSSISPAVPNILYNPVTSSNNSNCFNNSDNSITSSDNSVGSNDYYIDLPEYNNINMLDDNSKIVCKMWMSIRGINVDKAIQRMVNFSIIQYINNNNVPNYTQCLMLSRIPRLSLNTAKIIMKHCKSLNNFYNTDNNLLRYQITQKSKLSINMIKKIKNYISFILK